MKVSAEKHESNELFVKYRDDYNKQVENINEKIIEMETSSSLFSGCSVKV